MIKQNTSTSSSELVFYVDEDADDFTFYLERDGNNTVINTLLRDKLRQLKSQDTKTLEGETFTCSETVVVMSLFLTKANLNGIDDSFWKQLRTTRARSAHHYLRKKLEATVDKALNKPDVEGKDDLRKSLINLKVGKVDGKNKKILLPYISQALNEAIKGRGLESEPWVTQELPAREGALIKALPTESTKKRWRNRVYLQAAFADLIKENETGRGLICFSYVGKYLSVTFRRLAGKRGYAAKTDTTRSEYLFSIAEYCNLIYEEIFETTGSTKHAHGLLVVTGSTKSAKSEIARALIHLYLKGKEKKGTRRPHLVTFEDPIERFLADGTTNGSYPWAAIKRFSDLQGIDYTPRQKGKDVHVLKDALADALRQTPAAFFVGETRDKEEWELLLDFAATGHLIVTTAHASSLVEAMHKIFEARNVQTPAARSEIANKLLGVIHLRVDSITTHEEADPAEALFPALWRRTERGVAALTADGLASLLPHQSVENGNRDVPSCVGRRWFVERLINNAEADLKKAFGRSLTKPFGKRNESIQERTYKKATEWDLEGV
jgi:hypothetical protein